MNIASTVFALILLLTGCGQRDKQFSDAESRRKLTGTWKVEVMGPDHSSHTKGTLTVAADDTYREELVTTVSNELRAVTLKGYVRVEDGFLIQTATSAVPHWIPEAKRGTFPPGGATSCARVFRLDSHELVTETNMSYSVRYTKVRQ